MGEIGPGGHIQDPGKEARARAGLPIVPAFDGFRAYAILAVVVIHVAQISGVANTGNELAFRFFWGTFGRAVEVLFIVSGFVVFLPAVARGGDFGSLKAYAIRRGARLLPAFWLVLVFILILLAVFNLGNPVLRTLQIGFPEPFDLLLNLTALAVPAGLFSSSVHVGFGMDPPLWTLSAELGFYVVLPLIAGAFLRRPWIGLGIAAIITAAWAIGFDHVHSISNDLGLSLGGGESLRVKLASIQQLPTWAFSFGLGMAGAVVWVRLAGRRSEPAVRKRANWIALVALIAIALCAWQLGGDGALTRTSLLWSMAFSTFLGILMLSISLASPGVKKAFASPRVRQLGDISYGIYLSHYVFITLAVYAFSLPGDGSIGSFLLLGAIAIPPSLLYGYLSARFLEQPIRRWARRYGRRDEA